MSEITVSVPVKIYYEDIGEGEPIITSNGLMEDSEYWSETGVTARLAKRYRVISMDMRGHGRTVVDGEPYGYDVATILIRRRRTRV